MPTNAPLTTMTAKPGTRFLLGGTKRQPVTYAVETIDHERQVVIARDTRKWSLSDADNITFFKDFTFDEFMRRTGLQLPAAPPPPATNQATLL